MRRVRLKIPARFDETTLEEGGVKGSIRLDGQDLTSRRTDERAVAGIGYVPQGRGILPRFTVLENLRLGLFANPASGPGARPSGSRRGARHPAADPAADET